MPTPVIDAARAKDNGAPRALAAARRLGSGMAMLLLVGPATAFAQNRVGLEADLERLRADLRVPAMSAAVAEAGTLVWVRHFGSKAVPGDVVSYPVASLTKPFAAVLALRLAERGRLSLDMPVDGAGPGVEIRHLLSHTAAGRPGVRFVYSSVMFRLLGAPLAHASGKTFPNALTAEVIKPLGLRHTTAGPGTTPSSGVDSTVEDLAKFTTGLERGALLSPSSVTEMFRPPRTPGGQPLPYALGWFVQQIGGEQIRWHYGQDDGVSALLVNLPRRRLTFVLLARTDRLNAPFWLQFGDLRWSPAAVAFLTRWSKLRLDLGSARTTMIQALMALARDDRTRAAALARRAAVLAPGIVNGADPVLLAAFARSGVQELRELGRRIAARLLAADPDHPRVLLDLAVLHLQEQQPDEATRLLKAVLAGGQATPEIERTVRELMVKP